MYPAPATDGCKEEATQAREGKYLCYGYCVSPLQQPPSDAFSPGEFTSGDQVTSGVSSGGFGVVDRGRRFKSSVKQSDALKLLSVKNVTRGFTHTVLAL